MDNQNPSSNVQDAFFNQARRERSRVTVRLMDGRTLRGRVRGFDRFALILENGEGEQMIFKHAIATLSAARTFGNHLEIEPAGAESKSASGVDT